MILKRLWVKDGGSIDYLGETGDGNMAFSGVKTEMDIVRALDIEFQEHRVLARIWLARPHSGNLASTVLEHMPVVREVSTLCFRPDPTELVR